MARANIPARTGGSLGTGQVYSHEDRPIVHFGSPDGTRFADLVEDWREDREGKGDDD